MLYMEMVYEKMCCWVVVKCCLFVEEDDFVIEGDERVLRKAMSALRLRLMLFKVCVEEVMCMCYNVLFC